MDITAISDLHGFFPKDLPGGDLLIVAGDLTAKDHLTTSWIKFDKWLDKQPYKKKIVIAGNHDRLLQHNSYRLLYDDFLWRGVHYLCDSGVQVFYEDDEPLVPYKDGIQLPRRRPKSLKIWGSPWTKWFEGVNPKCTAFMLKTEEELAEKWAMIPDDTDILITHSPPYGILDKNVDGYHCGSTSLYKRIKQIRPKFHFFGHIHEGYYELGGAFVDGSLIQVFNCSHVNERYEPVNKPVRVKL
jgi:Icc-related predicted phosphoesterase